VDSSIASGFKTSLGIVLHNLCWQASRLCASTDTDELVEDEKKKILKKLLFNN
jgi:hypothetical protein